ncbi:MAG: DUF2490 domain-containing protein [Candidatus Kapaibacterium sp.]
MKLMVLTISLFSIWLLFIQNTFAQKIIEQTNQVWFENNLEFRLTDYLDAEMSNSVRMDMTNSILDNSFVQFGLSYNFLEYFKITGVYRVKTNEPEFLSEYFTNFNIKIPVNDFKIKLRSRYQNKDNIYRLKTLLRQRVMLDYEIIKKWTLSGSAEIFYEIDRDFIDRSRYKFDITHKIAKRNDLTIGYLFETQHNRKTPENRDVLYIELSVRVL